jgi:hypothetical protein
VEAPQQAGAATLLLELIGCNVNLGNSTVRNAGAVLNAELWRYF